MDERANDELAALRRRAYGPDADIHADAAALDRLRQLEHRDRESDSQALDPPTESDSDSAHVELSPHAEPTTPPDNGDGDDNGEQPRPILEHRPRRRLAWVWAGSLLGALLLGAAGTALVDALSEPATVTHVATLRQEADFAWPEFLGTATSDARGYGEFHGLTAVTTDREWSGPGTDTCMVVVKVSDVPLAASDGSVRYDCGTTAFPATVQFTVTDEMPDQLIERFPLGTELQFVLTSSSSALDTMQVDVFTAGDQQQ